MYSSVLKQKSGQFAISISFWSDSGVSCLKTLEVWHSEVSWRSWRDVHGDDYDIEDEIDDDDDDNDDDDHNGNHGNDEDSWYDTPRTAGYHDGV